MIADCVKLWGWSTYNVRTFCLKPEKVKMRIADTSAANYSSEEPDSGTSWPCKTWQVTKRTGRENAAPQKSIDCVGACRGRSSQRKDRLDDISVAQRESRPSQNHPTPLDVGREAVRYGCGTDQTGRQERGGNQER